ncbi:hypothetical protein F4818DRAFT_442453 [Hypoxylon cercidicola]|nr:hypothetical protein F4818DRAFT_442453 [Hypoxylon cercidicola]
MGDASTCSHWRVRQLRGASCLCTVRVPCSDKAICPVYAQEFSLEANESYTLRFSGKPPVTDIGFWSITMYDLKGTLMPNSINRYSLGDRSNLTYPDGTLVYDTDVEAPFDIEVQAYQPPADWTSNWLPSPGTPGPFGMIRK